MTRNDFELIAAALRKAHETAYATKGISARNKQTMFACPEEELIVNSIMDMLQAQNPRFRRDIFLTACGIENV